MASILVAEDDAAIRESIVWCLGDEGYTVLEAENGKVALDRMREHPEGLVVLLDLAMPEVDGYSVLQAMELEPPLAARHAVIVMTAQQRLLPMGFVEQITRLNISVLAKPFDLDKLFATVAAAAARLARAHEEAGLDP